MIRNKEIYKWVLLVFIVIFCNLYVLRLAIVYGVSMEPTLQQYDFVLIWQLGYTPCNGDIIVTNAHNGYQQSVIKRIVASEGQKVSILGGQVYIDGNLLEEKYLENVNKGLCDMPEMIVPEGHVFLLGDNREHSIDSRTMGCLSVECIRGKVLVKLCPFDEVKVFMNDIT